MCLVARSMPPNSKPRCARVVTIALGCIMFSLDLFFSDFFTRLWVEMVFIYCNFSLSNRRDDRQRPGLLGPNVEE